METMASVNKILLESILPAHVADYFLISPHRHTEVCSVIQYGHSRVYRFRSSGAAALQFFYLSSLLPLSSPFFITFFIAFVAIAICAVTYGDFVA